MPSILIIRSLVFYSYVQAIKSLNLIFVLIVLQYIFLFLYIDQINPRLPPVIYKFSFFINIWLIKFFSALLLRRATILVYLLKVIIQSFIFIYITFFVLEVYYISLGFKDFLTIVILVVLTLGGFNQQSLIQYPGFLYIQ